MREILEKYTYNIQYTTKCYGENLTLILSDMQKMNDYEVECITRIKIGKQIEVTHIKRTKEKT